MFDHPKAFLDCVDLKLQPNYEYTLDTYNRVLFHSGKHCTRLCTRTTVLLSKVNEVLLHSTLEFIPSLVNQKIITANTPLSSFLEYLCLKSAYVKKVISQRA